MKKNHTSKLGDITRQVLLWIDLNGNISNCCVLYKQGGFFWNCSEMAQNIYGCNECYLSNLQFQALMQYMPRMRLVRGHWLFTNHTAMFQPLKSQFINAHILYTVSLQAGSHRCYKKWAGKHQTPRTRNTFAIESLRTGYYIVCTLLPIQWYIVGRFCFVKTFLVIICFFLTTCLS